MGGLTDVTKSLLKTVVGTGAPVLAGLLGSPLAGVVVSLLADSFGADKTSVTDVLAKIQADPDAAAKLAKLENDHAEAMAKISATDFATETADRQDARRYGQMYGAFLIQMAFLVTAGFFGVLFVLFAPIEISEEGRNLLSMLVGMLASKWQTIIDFFFGSSHPKRDKKLL